MQKLRKACVLVNNNKRFNKSLEYPTTFDERFKFTLVLSSFTDVNLLSCELHHFTFNVLY